MLRKEEDGNPAKEDDDSLKEDHVTMKEDGMTMKEFSTNYFLLTVVRYIT